MNDGARGDGVVTAARPAANAEWVVTQTGPGTFAFQVAVNDHDEANPGPLHPRISATLTAAKDGTLRMVAGAHAGRAAQFGLHRAARCAHWPEAEVNISGPYPRGASPYAETRGFLDAHLHGMAFEFLGGDARCGRPWHPYGVTYALVDCPDHGPGGRGALLEDVVSGHTPGQGSRHRRLADVRLLAAQRLADPRAGLLQVAGAGLARRAADVHQPARRQRCAVLGLPAEEEQLQRDGRRAAAGQAAARVRALHRRAERRARRGLVPDRHRPVPGAPRGQRRQARGRHGHRGVRAVRLRRGPRACRGAPPPTSSGGCRRSTTSACGRWS